MKAGTALLGVLLLPFVCAVLPAQGQLRFGRKYRLPKNHPTLYDFTAGDVDGDGDLDLVFACYLSKNYLYLNDGKGGFQDGTRGRLETPWNNPVRAADLVDLDRDGDPDLLVSPDRFLKNLVFLNWVGRSRWGRFRWRR